jgi:tripartite-type tricarboxylate transporter receptor subunit TctC
MKLPRRTFLHLAAGAAALPAASRLARAQAYPTKPLRIIVGFAAGGQNDIVARLMSQWLSERLGQQFIVENRPGAGSNIGTEARPARRLCRTCRLWAISCRASRRSVGSGSALP